MNKLSIYEKLSLSTVRIECDTPDGQSTGTGFFFKFLKDNEKFVPAIVTNRHVVEGATRGYIYFTLSDGNNQPVYNKHHKFEILEFEKQWFGHPDLEVDLCAMPIHALIKLLRESDRNPYIEYIELAHLPTQEDIDQMAGMERVIMIGYPNGLWDSMHNQPVLRSGVLASHYKFNWNGKEEFLIDLSCVPGSSGSPVMIVDIGQVINKNGLNLGASRLKFLGVLYAGPVLSADGSIEIITEPANSSIRTQTTIPINLGYVIKGKKLIEFENVFHNDLIKNQANA